MMVTLGGAYPEETLKASAAEAHIPTVHSSVASEATAHVGLRPGV
jgi:hypothetical protein